MTVTRSSSYFGSTVTFGDDVIDTQVPLGESLTVKLGDNAGSTKWSLLDSDSVEVASIDSNGVATFGGGFGAIPGMLTFNPGAAVTAASYQIGRDADATNQLHFNVPTGASMEFSVNDVAALLINSSLDTVVTDDNFLQIGTTSSFGLVTHSSFPSPYSYISTNSSSNILLFGSWANRNFDFVNSAGLVSSQPVVLFTGPNQVRNRFVYAGMGSSEFEIGALNADDMDGTANNAKGTGIKISAGASGSSGGKGGSVRIITAEARAGNDDGGDVTYYFGSGQGTGRQGAIMAETSNADLRFKLNGTGLFRVESDNDKNSALTFGYNTMLGRALISNSATGGSFEFEKDIYLDSRFNLKQGSDTGSANDFNFPDNGNAVYVNGNTQINAITTERFQNGSMITMVFASNPVVKHNTAGGAGTAKLLLAGAADFNATANDVLVLQLINVGGTQYWVEIGRTVI